MNGWQDKKALQPLSLLFLTENLRAQSFGRELFSLPICVIMGLHRRAGACSRRNERLESKKAAGVNPRPTIKGYELYPKHLYYICETGDKTER